MYQVIGIYTIEGVSKSTKQPYHFYEVSVIPPESAESGLLGRRAMVLQLNDDELFSELYQMLLQTLRSGRESLGVSKIISHYSNGRRILDYVVV